MNTIDRDLMAMQDGRPSSAPLILKFQDIGPDLLPLVGGKAANLGVLTRAGLPVPQGFCVTTEAYRRVAHLAAIDEVFDSGAEAGVLAARMRELILAAAVPADITAAIGAYAVDEPVAVRSSATAEDLPHASFAGQQDTFLNVVGTEAVLDAVRRCWASLWTDRAVAYRDANGIDHRSVRLAVVVQHMIQSEVAGVMFTANPVTGRRHQAVIDASPGLGEAVVSGAVNPDHFVVSDGRVVERRIGDKRLVIRSLPGGGTEQVHGGATGAACLTDKRILELARLGERVERHYGSPQDTEWALDAAGTLWLTQARPITTLYPLAEGGAGLRVYFCFSLAQGLYRPITPMGVSAFRVLASSAADTLGFPVADRLAGPAVLADPGQRLFVDLTGILRSRVGRALVPRVLDLMEARSATVLRRLFDDPRLSVTQRSRLPFLRRVARVGFRYRIPAHILEAIIRPSAAHRRADREQVRLRVRLALPDQVTAAQRLDHVERVLATEAIPLAPRILPGAAAGFLMFGLASKLLGDKARPGELTTVLRGMPHNVTTEMDLALWRLAVRLRADGVTPERLAERPLPPVAEQGLAEFLKRYGHRAVAEIDLGLPRWSEDPTHVIGVLANYLRRGDPDLAPDKLFERGAREATQTIDALVSRAGGVRGRLVRFALGRTRALGGIRELPKFAMVLVLAAVRRQLATVGNELAALGTVAEPSDIFFLTLVEARTALDGVDQRALVAERREAYGMELRRRHVPRVLLSDGTEPEAVAHRTPGGDGLSGTPASAGIVTGIARVVLDPVGAHLEPGEILVAPSTDPGWTPLFLTSGGLVMEMGGANSHGAVVAREYGIPAVVGVPGAIERITTGQRITVDGTTGTVSIDDLPDT